MSENTIDGILQQERRKLIAERDLAPDGPAKREINEALFRIERRIRKRNLPLLGQVHVQAPCPERWDEMNGTDRRRFCDLCQKDVHNLSAMTRLEAEAFLEDSTDKDVCVTFYRRRDGKIMTTDCGPGQSRRAQLRKKSAWAGASILAGSTAAACTTATPQSEEASTFHKAALVEPDDRSVSDGQEAALERGEAPIVTAEEHHEPTQTTSDPELRPQTEENPPEERPDAGHSPRGPYIRGRMSTGGLQMRTLGRPRRR